MSRQEAHIVRRLFRSSGAHRDLSIMSDFVDLGQVHRFAVHQPAQERAAIEHTDIRTFIAEFREGFPELKLWDSVDLTAENDFFVASLQESDGRTMHFAGMVVVHLKDGRISAEMCFDDGMTMLRLGLLTPV